MARPAGAGATDSDPGRVSGYRVNESARSFRHTEDHENGACGSARWPPSSDRSSATLSGADAIVVGSGAAGGWAAKVLTEAGLKVLMLEAREPSAKRSDWKAVWWPKRLVRHAAGSQSIQQWHPTYWAKDPDLFINDRKFPYAAPPDMPFVWIRGGRPGGRSLLWGGVTVRLSDYEFAAAERDGCGIPWPIRHRDLAPFYDRVERFCRVRGTREELPQVPDGSYDEASRGLTAAEQLLGERIAHTWEDRRLIPSRGIAGNASSIATTIPAALATGRLTIRTGAAVSHLVPGRRSGRVGGVAFVDAATGQAREAHARLVFLCASTIESVRILLQTADEHPELPITESDCLGRYLMDHVTLGTALEMDGLPFEQPAPLSGADSFLIPRYQNLRTSERYLRGYGMWGAIQRDRIYGRRGRPARGQLLIQGEMLPDFENRVTLNGVTDRNGLRGVSIRCTWGENERAMHAAMTESANEILAAAGGRTHQLFNGTLPGPWRLASRVERLWRAAPPGLNVHEVGGARMGADRSTSVVDSRNRCWLQPNVLVTDGACWPSSGWQSPTLTMMALTARACALAAADLRRGNLN